MGTSDQTSDLWGRARTRDGARLSRQGISGSQENCGHLAACVCRICPLDRERRKGALGRVHGCSHSLSPTSYTVFLPHVLSKHRITDTLPRARAHTLTHTPRLSPRRQPGLASRAPQPPCGWIHGLFPSPPLHVGVTRRQAARLPKEPFGSTRSSREGAAQGSDGQSGRPIEPGTASPKGGSGGSDRPNERGARVGLPPGIPLAKIAGPWVTRKLGGRRRPPRFGSPVSDTGPRSPQTRPGQPVAHPATHPRGPRAERLPGVRLPLLGAHPLLLVATKSRSGSHREGAGSGRGGTPSAAGGSRATKWGGRREAGGVWGPARGQPAGKYAEGPLPGPGTRGESA